MYPCFPCLSTFPRMLSVSWSQLFFLPYMLSWRADLYLTHWHIYISLVRPSEQRVKSKDTLNLLCSDMKFVISFFPFLHSLTYKWKIVPFNCQSSCTSCQPTSSLWGTSSFLPPEPAVSVLVTSPLKILQWSPLPSEQYLNPYTLLIVLFSAVLR